MPGPNSERRNVTQPSEWWRAFEIQAAKEGLTLSEWMGACCAANLPRRVKLPPRVRRSPNRAV